MTRLGQNYKLYLVVSWQVGVHTGFMTASQSANLTAKALRQALGPGFGFAGPSERLLHAVTGPLSRRTGTFGSATSYDVAG